MMDFNRREPPIDNTLGLRAIADDLAAAIEQFTLWRRHVEAWHAREEARRAHEREVAQMVECEP